jgi:two-component system, LytTR family, sensor histidine kinase AlgZ
MNYEFNSLTLGTPEVGKKPRVITLLFVRATWIVLGATLIVFLIFLSSGHIRLSQSGAEIFASFVYSAMIAVPSVFLLYWIGHRLHERNSRLLVLMYALALVCAATVGSLAGALVLQWVGMVPQGGFWLEFRKTLPFSIVVSLMFGLSITTFETLRYRLQATILELRTRQMEQERAYKLLAEARLSSLESRIHPHLLFNTLNSIAALIPSDPARAEDTVGKLASLLRFSLNSDQSGLVPLSQELKIVRDYLEIEKTRFGTRIRYEIAIPESLGDAKIPPLALQSLVENAVKHVVSRRAQGALIHVTGEMIAAEGSNKIRLEVIDDGPGFSLEDITPEHGLGNLTARLDLLFGAAGRVEVMRRDEKNVVRLAFPA